LLLRVDDSARIRSPGDLAARRVRVVVREPDSGAQQLLERELRAAGVVLGGRSPALVASSHLGVARAIAMGAADVGVATRDAALLFGLRFVPLSEERYDLVVGKALLTDARVKRLFDALVSLPVRTELDALGYDVSQAGAHVADVRAS
jgi:molybdate-binding protein